MYRGQVTAVDTSGVYVLIPALHPTLAFGPLDRVGAAPAVGARVIVVDCGDESTPDLVAITGLGRVSIEASGNVIARGSSLSVRPASGFARIYADAAASGSACDVRFTTGTVVRWLIGKDSDAESGSNVGSRFLIRAYSDDAASSINALWITRATGKITIGAPGTTAGIELGSGGPTITTGTGAPSHSAPDGSFHLRTDGTASTTLYVRAAGAWSALS